MVQTHQGSCEEGTTTLFIFPFRRLKRFGMGTLILKILHLHQRCITALYGNCSASDRKTLHRVVRTAMYITGAKLPVIQELYTRWCQRKGLKIAKESRHPSHRLFSLLLHSKLYRSTKSRSKRLLTSFYPPKPEQLIKWLPGLFALTPFLRCCYSLFIIYA